MILQQVARHTHFGLAFSPDLPTLYAMDGGRTKNPPGPAATPPSAARHISDKAGISVRRVHAR